ncbi:flavodoxin family protein [Clostridium lacusfryxellense]|uniref:flavodoxin family protein n=1 Tax=Clostridium lacusfryxellense TaxID=205328 RepID=UPI001C0BF608|nr:flavodoxin [Clostridium lacusfryxellense]MBU3113909.1 flavodoxin [Clostridium lacusfryxellense]
MKAVMIYYSLEGNTDFIATKIAEMTGADSVRLIPKKEFSKGNFKKFIWGGKSAVFNEKPKLINEKINLDLYDTIIIGTPIWAGTFSPPIMTFLNDYTFKDKNIFLFACHAGGGAQKCFDKIKKMVTGNTVINSVDFLDPLKKAKEDTTEKIQSFCSSVMKS